MREAHGQGRVAAFGACSGSRMRRSGVRASPDCRTGALSRELPDMMMSVWSFEHENVKYSSDSAANPSKAKVNAFCSL